MRYLSTAVTVLAVSIILRYLLASGRRASERRAPGRRAPERLQDGARVLRYPGFVAVVGWVAVGFGALVGVVTGFRLVPMTGEDAVEFMLAGASAVAVGTANFVDPTAAERVVDGIEEYCHARGISRAAELTGGLKTEQ